MEEINSCLALAIYRFIIGNRIIINEIPERIALRYDEFFSSLHYALFT